MPLPQRITIELTNRCNRSCQSCPRLKSTYPQGNMTQELYSHLLEQLPDSLTIVPFFRGESLTHPLFPKMMGQLSRFKQVQLASNGDCLTLPNQTAILTGCTFFSLSLHELLMPWRVPCLQFLHIARQKGLQTQVSILNNLLQRNIKKRFVREWQKHVDRVRIYQEHSINGFGDMNGESKPLDECSKPNSEMVVYWDGKVGLCNHDWNNQTYLGDLNFSNIEEVWQSYNYQRVREWHQSGDRNKVPSCKECCFNNKMYGELYNARQIVHD